MYARDRHRVSPRKALRELLEETYLWRISPIVWHTLSLLLLFGWTSPLAVITVVGLHDALMVSNSAELRVFSLTIWILAPESTTNYLSSRSFAHAAEVPFLPRESRMQPYIFFELVKILARFQALLRAHRCCLCLFMGSVLKFHSVRTSLMRNFDIYFSQRWSFLFPDTRLTLRRLGESYSSNRFQDTLHRVLPRHSTLRNECI